MTILNKTEKQLSLMTSYTLGERLGCLHYMNARMYDYSHVFDMENREKLSDIIQNEINMINNILESRELEMYEGLEKRKL